MEVDQEAAHAGEVSSTPYAARVRGGKPMLAASSSSPSSSAAVPNACERRAMDTV